MSNQKSPFQKARELAKVLAADTPPPEGEFAIAFIPASECGENEDTYGWMKKRGPAPIKTTAPLKEVEIRIFQENCSETDGDACESVYGWMKKQAPTPKP